MQQRGLDMENEGENPASPLQPRGRTNLKLKVLVRSHAMREEASPPRGPASTSPLIKLIPSANVSPADHSPTTAIEVVLSPSLSRGTSPTSTLVPSPIAHSSASHSPEPFDSCRTHSDTDKEESTVCDAKGIISQSEENGKRNGRSSCTQQNCTRCSRVCEKNYNNILGSNFNNNNNNLVANTLTVSRAGPRGKLRQQSSSSQGSFEGSLSNSPCLSRDSSAEQYTDTTGVDLDVFITETLNRNAKDRALMLRIEQELVSLAKDKFKSHFKFPPMSSYQRMLVHRCAAYFGMDHNIESSGKCVVVNKTKCTRIPEVEFKEHIKEDIVFAEEPRRSILKRDSSSMDDYNFRSPDRHLGLENRRSKSFEEREEEYEKMHEFSSTEEFGWSEIPWSSTESESSSLRYRIYPLEKNCRLLKVQSMEAGNASSSTRPCIAKSYSFGGYGGISVLTRDDSVSSTHSAGPRLLTKQDSGASTVSWRLSPSSSGYKSQSQISESVTPSPTSTPNPLGEFTMKTNKLPQENQLIWAVTDIHNVPKGSVIINPQTGQPVKNTDGSVYHYDPSNLPPDLKCPSSPRHATAQETANSSPNKTPSQKYSAAHSPRRRSISSPSSKRANVTNTSTSPILPFSPPIYPSKNYLFGSAEIANVPPSYPQYSPVYGGNFTASPMQEGAASVFQQPCVVYASYGAPPPPPPHVPSHYEGRTDGHVQELPGNFYETQNVPTYQSAPFWNQQQQNVYQTPIPPPTQQQQQRFPLTLISQPSNFISAAPFPSNCAPPQPSQNPEVVPVYPSQPIHVVYSTPHHSNSLIYANPNVVYPQNPVYQNVMLPMHYPQTTITPTPCNQLPNNPSFEQEGFGLAQGMAHLSITPNSATVAPAKCATPSRTTKYGNTRTFPPPVPSSQSQSSTDPNSPATTVITNYANPPASSGSAYHHTPPNTTYQTPPTTPASSNMVFGYGPGCVPPLIFRQMSNVRASPPVPNRNSRSPTPANDMSYVDRQRFSLPPSLLRGMPYIVQSDSRMMVPGTGGQPLGCCRQHPSRPQSFGPTDPTTNRPHKNRKSRGNKPSGLPPSGK